MLYAIDILDHFIYLFIEAKLKEVLPVLLHFHGIIKAVDVFMNLDFKLALETLVDFRNTHKEMLPRKSHGNCHFFLFN